MLCQPWAMVDETMTFRLPRAQKERLYDLARKKDETPGQILRGLLADELNRKPAKTPNRADEQLVARLQRLLAPLMADARGWHDLSRLLRAKGFELRPAGGGLTLHELGSGTRLCKSSELGFAYSRLVRRLQPPMPGHPHRMNHILCGTDRGVDDLDLIDDR